MDHPWRLSATALAQAIRTRGLGSREATESCLARTREVNPEINAIVDLLEDEALAAADAADRAVARGDALGPLHGVPVTVKVNVDMRGRATTNGIVALRDAIATEDSPVVSNLRRAGAVIFGRTNTPAFSYRWFTENDLHGRTLNPWDRGRTPGGSSGGASAAVATGMGPIAHGNDLAGSVRYPAYCTGVYGLRPSFGRVPAFLPSAKEERTVGMQTMSVQGPLARTVADLRIALEAMAMPDPRDPWYAPVPLRGPAPARPIRIAMTTSVPGADVHPAVRRAVEQAGAWLAEAGYALESIDPPHLEEAPRVWAEIAETEARLGMHEAIDRLGDAGIRRAASGMRRGVPQLDLAGYVRAMSRRSTIVRDWFVFMERFPVVLGPVSAEPPFPWGLDTGTDAEMDRVLRAQGPQFLLPVVGLPGLAAPLGELDGVPLGVQLVAARYREDLLFDAAEVLEARHPSRTPIDPAWTR